MASMKAGEVVFYVGALIGGLLAVFLTVYNLIDHTSDKSVVHHQWRNNDTNLHHMTEWHRLLPHTGSDHCWGKHARLGILVLKDGPTLFPGWRLAVYSKPIVLHNTPFDTWQSAHWTPTLLANSISYVLSKRGPENVFRYFATDQPLSTVKSFSTKKPFQEIVYPGKEFFNILQEPFHGYYYYASGGIELLELKDTYTAASLSTLTFPSHDGLGQVNFWFGQKNVTAYTHYDTSHNLHAMIYGKKTFLLFPPSAFTELRLHPALHQFYRQVHKDILDHEVLASLETKPLKVVLNPGEVLYMPPYWFHCVVSMETSISLNVWSNSEAFLQMEEIFALPIPFEEEWGRKKLLQALSYLLKNLLHAVVPAIHGTFVKERVLSRYEPLLQNVDLLEVTSQVQQFCLWNPVEQVLDESSVHHIHGGIEQTAELFMAIHPEAVREINLANYIEHIVWRILGNDDVLLLPVYLNECF